MKKQTQYRTNSQSESGPNSQNSQLQSNSQNNTMQNLMGSSMISQHQYSGNKNTLQMPSSNLSSSHINQGQSSGNNQYNKKRSYNEFGAGIQHLHNGDEEQQSQNTPGLRSQRSEISPGKFSNNKSRSGMKKLKQEEHLSQNSNISNNAGNLRQRTRENNSQSQNINSQRSHKSPKRDERQKSPMKMKMSKKFHQDQSESDSQVAKNRGQSTRGNQISERNRRSRMPHQSDNRQQRRQEVSNSKGSKHQQSQSKGRGQPSSRGKHGGSRSQSRSASHGPSVSPKASGNQQVQQKNGSTNRQKNKSSQDNIYSKSFQYKTGSSHRQQRSMNRGTTGDSNLSSIRTRPRNQNNAPQTRGTTPTQRQKSPVGRRPAGDKDKSRSKGPGRSKSRKNSKQRPKEERSSQLDLKESEIRKILDLYFDYMIEQIPPRIKIKAVKIGKIMKKLTFEKQQSIVLTVSNICFEQNGGVLGPASISDNSYESKKDSKRVKSNTPSGKDFRVCDIIDFSYNKKKHIPNQYLIRRIEIKLDFSGKINRIEKQDEELPDIEIVFKVHPLVTKSLLKDSSFHQASSAIECIRSTIDEEFCLDLHGNICIFEIGSRKVEDERLNFELFMHNLQQTQKSFQFDTETDEMVHLGIDQYLKLCKQQNQLQDSVNYEKKYVVIYGYKYEDPSIIYQISQKKQKIGKELYIKQWDIMKHQMMPLNINSTSKFRDSLDDQFSNQSMNRLEDGSNQHQEEGIEQPLDDFESSSAISDSDKEEHNQPDHSRDIKENERLKKGHTRPISVQKNQLLDNNEATDQAEIDNDRTLSEHSDVQENANTTKVEPFRNTHIIQPRDREIQVEPSRYQHLREPNQNRFGKNRKQYSTERSDHSSKEARGKKKAGKFENEQSSDSEHITRRRGRSQMKRVANDDSSSDQQKLDKSRSPMTRSRRGQKEQKEQSSEYSESNESASKKSASYSQKNPKGKIQTRRGRGNNTIIEESREEEDVSMIEEDPYSDDYSEMEIKSKRSRATQPKRGASSRRPETKALLDQQQASAASNDDQYDDEDDQEVLHGYNEVEQPKESFDNEYDEACSKLQLNSIPKELPCRDAERKQITDYLKLGIEGRGSSSSLYISGMPGTGKTATTLEVLRKLIPQYKRTRRSFEFIHINAMSLTNPNLVYTILAEKIIGRRMNPQSAALFLDEFFKRKDKKQVVLKHISRSWAKNTKALQKQAQKMSDRMRVLLVDELDALITPKQTLLYNLFEWPCNQNSNLLVISIANTMDLPERLQSKIQSRIGNNRLVYEPYSSSQIEIILQSRMSDISIFADKSLMLVSKKVAQFSGDIRRSLQITKRAVEICRDQWLKLCDEAKDKEKGKKPDLITVKVDHILAAAKEMQNSKVVNVLKGLRKLEVLFIIALLLEIKSRKQERILIDHVQDRCQSITNSMVEYENKRILDEHQEDLNQLGGQIDSEMKTPVKRYATWKNVKFTTSIFRDIVKRLQAFGLINLIVETCYITDNVHLQCFLYDDEIKNAFEHHEVYKCQKDLIAIHSSLSND